MRLVSHYRLLLLSLLVSIGCYHAEPQTARRPAVLGWQGPTMGTVYNITFIPPADFEDLSLERLRTDVDRELRKFSDQMSTYLESSEISRFNHSNSTDWFDVSPEFAQVVEYALKVSAASEGAFDITVAPLVNAWGFGPETNAEQQPSTSQIEALKQLTGYQHLSVRLDPPAIKKSLPTLQIDLNAIAPGHATDQLIALLQRQGIANALVDIGGEVRAIGSRPGGGPWRVGIERPDGEGQEEIEQVVPLTDRSLATSGDYRKFFIDPSTSRRFSHTIDPRTGYPVAHQLASVSVLADTCMAADAWATAITVLGPQAGYEKAIEQKLDVLLIERTENGLRSSGCGALKPQSTDPR